MCKCECAFTAVDKDLSLCIAHGDQCHCVLVMESLQTLSAVEDLTCDHQECDTRFFMHNMLHRMHICTFTVLSMDIFPFSVFFITIVYSL